MSKRTRWWAGVGLAVLVASVAILYWPRRDRVTAANAERIEVGMTPAQVEGILGPPGDYRTGPLEDSWDQFWYDDGKLFMSESKGIWLGDAGILCIDYYTDGGSQTVGNASFEPSDRVKQYPVQNFVWRVKRQWRRWFGHA